MPIILPSDHYRLKQFCFPPSDTQAVRQNILVFCLPFTFLGLFFVQSLLNNQEAVTDTLGHRPLFELLKRGQLQSFHVLLPTVLAQ